MKSFQIFEREVDSSVLSVLAHVPENIGKLEGNAALLRELRGGRVVKSQDVQGTEADDRGYAIAVLIQVLKRAVRADGEVHLRPGDQLVEIFGRDGVSPNRSVEGRKD